MSDPNSFSWGLNADDLAEQQANYAQQDSDSEDDDVSESNGDYEVSEQSDSYGSSSDFYAPY